jgi:hypothetical protein
MDPVSVERAFVGVADDGDVRTAVERKATDALRPVAVLLQLGAAKPAVVRLDSPDRSKQRPAQSTRRVARR